MATKIWVNIYSVIGFLPVNTKPVSEPMFLVIARRNRVNAKLEKMLGGLFSNLVHTISDSTITWYTLQGRRPKVKVTKNDLLLHF